MSEEDFNLSNLDDLDLGDFDMDLNLDDMEKVRTDFYELISDSKNLGAGING